MRRRTSAFGSPPDPSDSNSFPATIPAVSAKNSALRHLEQPIPDFSQDHVSRRAGTSIRELSFGDLSLVDRTIDGRWISSPGFKRLRTSGMEKADKDLIGLMSDLLADREDGRIKLFLIARALEARRLHHALFRKGVYLRWKLPENDRNHIVHSPEHTAIPWRSHRSTAILDCFGERQSCLWDGKSGKKLRFHCLMLPLPSGGMCSRTGPWPRPDRYRLPKRWEHFSRRVVHRFKRSGDESSGGTAMALISNEREPFAVKGLLPCGHRDGQESPKHRELTGWSGGYAPGSIFIISGAAA